MNDLLTKAGNKSSEFWLICIYIALVAFNKKMGLMLSEQDLLIIGGLAGVYTGGRSLVKSSGVKQPKETIVWRDPPAPSQGEPK